jgi:3-oxoacyl-[acyl-carrier-protein] synthase-1
MWRIGLERELMLAITGMGLISAVGRDVASSCASLRAGISRARGLLSYQVLNADDQEPMPVRACPVHGFTEGFQHLGLWVRLASAALSDMIQFSGLPGSGAGSWYGTALAVVAPLLNQHRFDGAELLSDSLFES